MEERLLYPIDGDPPTALDKLGGMGRSTFYEEVRAGRITLTKIGRRSYVSADELNRYVAALATEPVTIRGSL